LNSLSPTPVQFVFIRQRPSISSTANYLPTNCNSALANSCFEANQGDVLTAYCTMVGPPWPHNSTLVLYARVWLRGFIDPATHQTVGYVPEGAYTPAQPLPKCTT
jgi:hypothetical protein